MSGRNFFSDAQRNGVFAFIDFKAWNGTYGAGDAWRKFTYSQTASAADENLVKTGINESVFSVFSSFTICQQRQVFASEHFFKYFFLYKGALFTNFQHK